MLEVSEEMKVLFSSEQSVFALGYRNAEHLVSDVSESAMAEYDAGYAERDIAADLVTSLEQDYYVEQDFSRDPLLRTHQGTDVYNDWYVRNGLTSAIGLFVRGASDDSPDRYARRELGIVANILLAGSPMSTGDEADKARTLLAIIHPALEASVSLIRRSQGLSSDACQLLDALDEQAWIIGSGGQCTYRTPTLPEQVRSEADARTLTEAARGLALEAIRATDTPVPFERRVRLRGGDVLLSATLLPPDGLAGPRVLVRVPHVGQRWPSEDLLRQRFGLTPKEARVAILRAKGLSAGDLASSMDISVHTARRHTEQVLAKLGLRRIAEIGPAILGLSTTGE